LEDNKYYSLNDADELRKWGNEIDELQARVNKTKTRFGMKPVNRLDELSAKIESARDNLIQTFYSLRSQDYRK
jgi:tetrahydromethanopterin S-methyltransferase subunit G